MLALDADCSVTSCPQARRRTQRIAGLTRAWTIRSAESRLEIGGAKWIALPAAVIERASLPDERSVLTTLGELLHSIEREGMCSPCIIVVGDVLHGAAAALAQPALRLAV